MIMTLTKVFSKLICMKKNSFGQGLAVFFVIVGVLFIIGSIGEASEPKCIKAGCDNKQASGRAAHKILCK